ncbi:MAG: menaquinone biosynthesis protein [Pirellulales bacterium]|nr:menaquinone biosynthesis protein [Pirellulales bacterium]
MTQKSHSNENPPLSDELGTLRIGAVSYLNTKPLIYCLEELIAESAIPDAQLVVDLPSRLARGIAEKRLDVALIPSIEYVRHEGYSIISDACVGCNGAVESVKLYGRVPVSEIGTLAVDEGSRTSAVLTRILLAERYDVHPQVTTLEIGSSPSDSTADAVMLIGDRGMIPIDGPCEFVWDLGREWCDWTGLPFVFAMWIARGDVSGGRGELAELERLLSLSRDRGMDMLEEIARAEAPSLGLSVEHCHNYLRDNLTYRLGDAERRGLQKFYELAARYGLVLN